MEKLIFTIEGLSKIKDMRGGKIVLNTISGMLLCVTIGTWAYAKYA